MKTIKITDQIEIDQESIDSALSISQRFIETKAFPWLGDVAIQNHKNTGGEGLMQIYSVKSRPVALLSAIYVELKATRSPLLDDEIIDDMLFPILSYAMAHANIQIPCIDDQVGDQLETKYNMERVRALIFAGHFSADFDSLVSDGLAQKIMKSRLEPILQFCGYREYINAIGLLAAAIAFLKHSGHPISWITEP
jgi:hypothetical protein